MTRLPLALLLVSSAASAAGAAEHKPQRPDRPCSPDEVRTVRRDGEKLVKAGQLDEAIKLYQSLEEKCVLLRTKDDDSPNEDYYWFVSDQSLALLKAGKPGKCRKILSDADDPTDGLDAAGLADSKVGKSIRHNRAACEKAFKQSMLDFASPPCPIKGTKKAVTIPAAAPSGTPATCLVLRPARARLKGTSDDLDNADRYCPKIVLLTAAGGSKPVEAALAATGGRLVRTSDCCNLTKIQTASRDGKLVVRVKSAGAGRDCLGGTASVESDVIYSVDPAAKALTELDDFSISLH